MGIKVPAMRRLRERGRSDRAYVVLNGKRHKLCVWGSEAAEQRYRDLIAGKEPEKPKPSIEIDPPTRPTVVEIMAPYMRRVVEAYPSDGSEVWCYRSAMKILKAEFGELPADEFGPRRLRVVRDAMVAQGWSRQHVNSQVSRVRRLFRWAASEERLVLQR
jgi:hypothetical protein